MDKNPYTPDKMFCQTSDHLEYWNRFEWTMLSAISNWWWVINLMFLFENIRLLCKVPSWRRGRRCGRFGNKSHRVRVLYCCIALYILMCMWFASRAMLLHLTVLFKLLHFHMLISNIFLWWKDTVSTEYRVLKIL